MTIKKSVLSLGILLVLLVAGCKHKTYFSTTFDHFTINIYDNTKQYLSDTIPGTVLAYKQKHLPSYTGFTNSFVVLQQTVDSGTNLQDLVNLNIKTNQAKLLKYKNIKNTAKKTKCVSQQYSGYVNTFSYQMLDQTLYVGQYFLLSNETVYLLSLSSDTLKDVEYFVESISTIKCINK